MKRIILTESQYKRLVKQPLNEQEIIFGDGYSWGDNISKGVSDSLLFLMDSLGYRYKENLYIKYIGEDKLVIDLEKYGDKEEVKSYIVDELNRLFTYTDDTKDSIDDEGNIYFSFDTEPVDGETVVDDLSIRQKIVDKAYTRFGEPYKWGCEFDEKGGDCSGIIDWTLRNVDGIDSPYNGRENTCKLHKLIISKNLGRKNDLDKGDMLIFEPKNHKWTCTEDNPGHVGFVYDVRGDKVDMIDAAVGVGVRILKNVFNKSLGKNRYYGVIPIVGGKYESN